MTALHIALNYNRKEIAIVLIDNGADLNSRDKINYWTPIHYAAIKNNNLENSNLLIQNGAEIDVKDMVCNFTIELSVY